MLEKGRGYTGYRGKLKLVVAKKTFVFSSIDLMNEFGIPSLSGSSENFQLDGNNEDAECFVDRRSVTFPSCAYLISVSPEELWIQVGQNRPFPISNEQHWASDQEVRPDGRPLQLLEFNDNFLTLSQRSFRKDKFNVSPNVAFCYYHSELFQCWKRRVAPCTSDSSELAALRLNTRYRIKLTVVNEKLCAEEWNALQPHTGPLGEIVGKKSKSRGYVSVPHVGRAQLFYRNHKPILYICGLDGCVFPSRALKDHLQGWDRRDWMNVNVEFQLWWTTQAGKLGPKWVPYAGKF